MSRTTRPPQPIWPPPPVSHTTTDSANQIIASCDVLLIAGVAWDNAVLRLRAVVHSYPSSTGYLTTADVACTVSRVAGTLAVQATNIADIQGGGLSNLAFQANADNHTIELVATPVATSGHVPVYDHYVVFQEASGFRPA